MRKSFLSTTLKGTKLYILLTLLLSAVYSKLLVYVPMFIKYALDGVILENESVIPTFIQRAFYDDSKISKVIILIVFLIFVNVLIFITNYIKSKMNTKFNLKINRNVKELVLEHIPNLEYMQFCNIDKANVIQRVNNDATTYAEFFNSQINLFFDTFFLIIFAVIQTFQLNAVIGMFIMFICFLIVCLSIWYFRKSKPLVEDIVEMNKEVIQRATTGVEDSKMLKIFNRKEKEINEFSTMNLDYKNKDIKLEKLKVIYGIGTHCLRNFKEPFILLYGGILVVQGDMSLATISILLTYATKILEHIYKTVDKLKLINEFFVAYRKLSNLMQIPEEIEKNENVDLTGDIIFKNVSIKLNENEILNNLNFSIKPNENVAIIGDNGSGKTVLAKTLIGFYDYTGDIYIGEHNIRNVSKNSLRRYIGIVLQETYIFTGTIRNNINFSDSDISDEKLLEICKMADIYEDINNFDGKLNYLVGKGGNNISGGQKQRIAIARTLLMDNKIIIFDDSLSKLDSKTKVNILNNVIKMKRGAIIISHDIEVVKKCDKVLFIDNSSIEIGSHEEFMKNNNRYKEIIEISQNMIFKEDEV